MKTVGIVIPCYNEGASILELIEKCKSSFHNQVRYLIVNNGSTDNSKDILERIELPRNIQILHIENNQGYGFGIIQGLNHLSDDYVGWTHADLQTDPSDILKFLPSINQGIDFMKGNRVGRPVIDRFFTWGMTVLISALFLQRMHDINAQPTIFHRDLLTQWHNPPNDFALDLYAYLVAVKLDCTIVRKKVNFGPRRWGNSHWNTGLSARLKFIHRTLRIAFRLRVSLR